MELSEFYGENGPQKSKQEKGLLKDVLNQSSMSGSEGEGCFHAGTWGGHRKHTGQNKAIPERRIRTAGKAVREQGRVPSGPRAAPSEDSARVGPELESPVSTQRQSTDRRRRQDPVAQEQQTRGGRSRRRAGCK